MSKKKKLTLKEKIKMSKENICWKCNGNISYNKEIKSLECDDCRLIIDVKSKLNSIVDKIKEDLGYEIASLISNIELIATENLDEYYIVNGLFFA